MNPLENRSGNEGGWRPQRKVGLETPLTGRIWGENKRLVLSPPAWYQALVVACLAFGGWGLAGGRLGLPHLPFVERVPWVSLAVLFAGVWAVLSTEYVVFDLKARTYFRREGGGLLKRTRRGSLMELDAVVLYAEEYPFAIAGRSVIYRIVVHWKNARAPLLVGDRMQVGLPMNVQLNHLAGPISARAQRYAQLLGVRYHDNAYFHSPAPQKPV